MGENRQTQAVIYCRVSSIKQTKDGDGLRSQETRCRDFAARKGYVVTDVFQDDVSGSLVDRPGMKAMLASIRKRRAHGVVVVIDDVSRLARGLQAHLELRGLIAGAGGNLESPSIEFGEDPDSLLVENLLASVSQHQRQKNGEQTKNRMRSRVLNGYWVFQAPIGYHYQRVTGRGMMLKRDEPVASILQEGLEGYASGRFETQADVMRFFQADPLFPKDRAGRVHQQRVANVLNQCCYAGYVEAPNWDVARRPGQHDALITYETFGRIQDRLAGVNRLPKRHNLNADFPLRGFVLCADCETPLTACWSTGTPARHPYYLCPKRGCASYGKSTRRDRIEGEFETLLQSVQPTEGLFRVAIAMFRELWSHRLEQAAVQRKALEAQLAKLDGQVSQLLTRILDTSVPSVIGAYEEKVRALESDKLLIQERLASAGRPVSTFDNALRTALAFLANPCKLLASDRLEDRRTVLKLTFADRLRYKRNEGFRTADLSLPFRVLSGFLLGGNEMAHPTRFERVTSAFGEKNKRFVGVCVRLRLAKNVSKNRRPALSELAVPCSGLISAVTYLLPRAWERLPRMAVRVKIGLREIRSLGPDQEIWDVDPIGFGARRQRSDAIAYIVMYRTREGRLRRLTIGRHGKYTPETARNEAKRILGAVAAGEDPATVKVEARKASTVAELCDMYLADAEAGRLLTRRRVAKKASTLATDRGRIEQHIKPLIGRQAIAAISRDDIEGFMHNVAEGKTAKRERSGKVRGLTLVTGGKGTASRTVGLLGAMFTYAVRKGLRADNPTQGVMRFADGRRERRLSDAEYQQLGAGMTKLKSSLWPPALAATRFLALTGWRRGEALGLLWSEVDLERRTATLEDTKTGRSMRPLSTGACAVLAALPRAGPLVFAGSRGAGPMTGLPKYLSKILLAGGLPDDITPHVLRHSFASVASDIGLSEPTIGALIGHKGQSMTSRYVHSADAVLLAAADQVAGRIAVLLKGPG